VPVLCWYEQDEMSALLGQVVVTTFATAPGAEEEAPKLSEFIAATFGPDSDSALQPETSLAALYERSWVRPACLLSAA
jgi:hypothetical protein